MSQWIALMLAIKYWIRFWRHFFLVDWIYRTWQINLGKLEPLWKEVYFLTLELVVVKLNDPVNGNVVALPSSQVCSPVPQYFLNQSWDKPSCHSYKVIVHYIYVVAHLWLMTIYFQPLILDKWLHLTLTYYLDLQSQPSQSQCQPTYRISRSQAKRFSSENRDRQTDRCYQHCLSASLSYAVNKYGQMNVLTYSSLMVELITWQ